ncbi:hypothetical protein J2X71_002646 [Rhizobium sp. 1399]|nr:hypothetical protein [Rhizobium sp. 1399]
MFFFVMLILGVVFAYTPISENYRRFGITTTVDVYGNIIRSGANIFAVYFSIYLLIFRLSAYIRAHK